MRSKQEFYKAIEKRAKEGVENYVKALHPDNPDHEPSQAIADMVFNSMVEAIVSQCGMYAANTLSEAFHRMNDTEAAE